MKFGWSVDYGPDKSGLHFGRLWSGVSIKVSALWQTYVLYPVPSTLCLKKRPTSDLL